MIKKPYQFLYVRDLTPETPKETILRSNCTEEDLKDGTLLSSFPGIDQIGIQSSPGISFSFNNSDNYIEIGKTGIYELDLSNSGAIINSIKFNPEIFKKLTPSIQDSNYFFIIIDIIYKAEDDTVLELPAESNSNSLDIDIISGGGALS